MSERGKESHAGGLHKTHWMLASSCSPPSSSHSPLPFTWYNLCLLHSIQWHPGSFYLQIFLKPEILDSLWVFSPHNLVWCQWKWQNGFSFTKSTEIKGQLWVTVVERLVFFKMCCKCSVERNSCHLKKKKSLFTFLSCVVAFQCCWPTEAS